MRHFFSVADALRINKKLMAQKSDLQLASQAVFVPGLAAHRFSGAIATFSVKEMNDAMTKARELLAA